MARATEPPARTISAALLTLLAALGPAAVAQDPQAPAREQRERFTAERKQSVESGAARKFSPQLLGRADDLAKQAGAAADAGQPDDGARLYRDARWLLPALPADFPEHVTRVFGDPRLRHGDRVTALAYSPDGRRLATASRDATVKVWDLGSGRELLTYRGHG